jgi:hypothetical protein
MMEIALGHAQRFVAQDGRNYLHIHTMEIGMPILFGQAPQ